MEAEVDPSSSHQAISIAGLNLSNPKTEAKNAPLLCQTCWCVDVRLSSTAVHTWKQKMSVLSPVRVAGERKRGAEGSETKWQRQCIDPGRYCGKYHREAAELYVTVQGWESWVCLCVRGIHLTTELWKLHNPKMWTNYFLLGFHLKHFYTYFKKPSTNNDV